MARVNPVGSAEAAPELQEIYRVTIQALGKTSNFFRTVAHRPRMLRDLVTFSLHFLRNDEPPVLDLALKWRLILRTAAKNQCHY